MKRTSVAIVGAGPAGMAAAATLARHGLDCILLDEQGAAGGQVYRGIQGSGLQRAGILGKDYLSGTSLVQGLQHERIQRCHGAMVWSLDNAGVLTYTSGQQAGSVQADVVLLATGAQERPFAFRGWSLPGVMTAGAAQILLKAHGLIPAAAVLAGNGPLLYLLAMQLIRAGCPPQAILETRAPGALRSAMPHLPAALRDGKGYLWKGLKMLAAIRRAGVKHYQGIQVLEACGDDQLAEVAFRWRGKPLRLASDTLLIHQGVIPNTQMTRALGLKHVWDERQQAWKPQTDEWGHCAGEGKVFVAGDGAGIGGAAAAVLAGQLSALQIVTLAGVISPEHRDVLAAPLRRRLVKELAVRPFLDTLYAPDYRDVLQDDAVLVCRCEEVTAGQLREHVRHGCRGLNQAKVFSRCGMGPCQGRQCGLTAAVVMADARQTRVDAIDYYRIRMPLKPVTLQELASLSIE